MQSSDIKNAGLKLTLPRMKILELLESSDERHLKAEDITKTCSTRVRKLPSLLSTVF